jgi:NCS2 family nucleobase:cation symporter-2
MLDVRKNLVVGLSLLLGLIVEIRPETFAGASIWMQPILSSSLSTATISALILNLVFRIGITSKAKLDLQPGVHTSETIFNFMDRQGRAWGAREEVIGNATAAMNEFLEAVSEFGYAREPIHVTVSFDEYNLDVDMDYKGKAIEMPSTRPDSKEVLVNADAGVRLAGYLILQYADKVLVSYDGETCRTRLHFAH